ncbi:MAG: hypothetical protein V8R90_07340 [Eubacterium sp.]
MYRVTFNGYRDPEFEISIKDVMDCGNIVTVIDETIPDFDFEEMYATIRIIFLECLLVSI